MRAFFALSFGLTLVLGCARHAPPSATPAAGAPAGQTPPGQEGAPPAMPLAPANAPLAWMLGAWDCSAAYQPLATAPDAHAHGRLLVDAYMDVWMGAGFEADVPGVPKGDMYFRYDEVTRAWTLMGFRSDGSHYTLTSPGELGGRFEWTGTLLHEGQSTELHAVWSHKGKGQLDIRMERVGGSPWTTFELVCAKPAR